MGFYPAVISCERQHTHSGMCSAQDSVFFQAAAYTYSWELRIHSQREFTDKSAGGLQSNLMLWELSWGEKNMPYKSYMRFVHVRANWPSNTLQKQRRKAGFATIKALFALGIKIHFVWSDRKWTTLNKYVKGV